MHSSIQRSATTIHVGMASLFLCLLIAATAAAQGEKRMPFKFGQPAKPSLTPDSSDKFFARGEIPELRIELTVAQLAKLREDNRRYVKVKLIENQKTTYQEVALKLKGAAGSFREIDDKPAFTLNVAKHDKEQTFHSLHKLHLNNSVQDETYLHELLCSELFRAAGIPTPRVTHARVWFNGRDLGLYVLKEGFDKMFLKRYFTNATGNLYDGGFLQEIDVALELDEGSGPDDRSDLRELAAACELLPIEERFQQISERLDVDRFLTFMALELMTAHWDGYCLNKNNYRVYFNPTDHRAHFFPHGMDQMFGDPGAAVFHFPPTLVCTAVLQNEKWRATYRQRVADLLPLFSPVDPLLKRVDEVAARLQPVLAAMGEEQVPQHVERIADLKNRLRERAENLQRMKDEAFPEPLEFDARGRAALPDWYEQLETDGVKIEQTDPERKPRLLQIATAEAEVCVASWRTHVLLAPGKYKLIGRAKATNVQPLDDDPKIGAGLRISGLERTNKLVGTTGWKALEFEFEVAALQPIQLIAELRSKKGQVAFDVDTFFLLKQ